MGVRGWARRVFGGSPAATGPRPMAFSGPVYPVDQLWLHMLEKVGKVDRAKALTVPAVLRGRNMICSIATLPLAAYDQDNRRRDVPLLQQFNPDIPNLVQIAQTVEDLLFESIAWWRVTAFQNGRPAHAVRYEPTTVSLQAPDDYEEGYLPSGQPYEGVVWMGGEAVPFDQVIRFDSPNPPLLLAGEDAIRRALALDATATMYAQQPGRRGYFTPKEDVDPIDDDTVTDLLDTWAKGAASNATGYVPAALDYNDIQAVTPAELQLVNMQQRATLDIANALGIDPEDLGISTTSRTYQNATDRRRDRINDVLSPYMQAITQRLSMPDVTARPLTVRFGLDDYLRADPKTRAEVQQLYIDMGVTDAEEVREDEGRPPKKITPPAVRPAVPNTQISAIPAGAR